MVNLVGIGCCELCDISIFKICLVVLWLMYIYYVLLCCLRVILMGNVNFWCLLVWVSFVIVIDVFC